MKLNYLCLTKSFSALDTVKGIFKFLAHYYAVYIFLVLIREAIIYKILIRVLLFFQILKLAFFLLPKPTKWRSLILCYSKIYQLNFCLLNSIAFYSHKQLRHIWLQHIIASYKQILKNVCTDCDYNKD